jgi:hypothetical protein
MVLGSNEHGLNESSVNPVLPCLKLQGPKPARSITAFPSLQFGQSLCKHHEAHLKVRPKNSRTQNTGPTTNEPTSPVCIPSPLLRYHQYPPIPHRLICSHPPSSSQAATLPPSLRSSGPWRSPWRGPSRASPWCPPPPPPSRAATAPRSPSAAQPACRCRCRRGGSPSRWRTRRGPGAPRTAATPRDSASGSRYTATSSPSPGPSSSASAAPGSCPPLAPFAPLPVTGLLWVSKTS